MTFKAEEKQQIINRYSPDFNWYVELANEFGIENMEKILKILGTAIPRQNGKDKLYIPTINGAWQSLWIPVLAEKIREYHANNPDASDTEIAELFNVQSRRVRKALS